MLTPINASPSVRRRLHRPLRMVLAALCLVLAGACLQGAEYTPMPGLRLVVPEPIDAIPSVLRFSPDGRRLVLLTRTSVFIHDAASGRQLRHVPWTAGLGGFVAVDAALNRFVCGGSGTILVCDAEGTIIWRQTLQREVKGPIAAAPVRAAISDDGRLVAYQDGQEVVLTKIPDGKRMVLPCPIGSLAFLGNDRLVGIPFLEGDGWIWDIPAAKIVAQVAAQGVDANSRIAVSPGHQRFAWKDKDGKLAVVGLDGRRLNKGLDSGMPDGSPWRLRTAAFADERTLIAIAPPTPLAAADGKAPPVIDLDTFLTSQMDQIWRIDLDGERPAVRLATVPGRQTADIGMGYAPSESMHSSLAVSLATDRLILNFGNLPLMRLQDGTVVHQLKTAMGSATIFNRLITAPLTDGRPGISADGRWIIHPRGHLLDVWDLWSGTPRRSRCVSITTNLNTGAISFRMDGTALLHLHNGNQAIILDERRADLFTNASVRESSALVLAGAHEGTRRLIIEGSTNEVSILDESRGNQVLPGLYQLTASRRGMRPDPQAMAIRTLVDADLSADGRLAALAYAESVASRPIKGAAGLALYDSASRSETQVALDPQTSPTCVRFAPSDTRLAIGAENGLVYLTSSREGDFSCRIDATAVTGLAWAADGRSIAISTQGGGLFELDPEQRTVRRCGALLGTGRVCAWLPGRRVLARDRHQRLSILPLDGGPRVVLDYHFNNDRWLCSTDTGIWDGSKDCTALFDVEWNNHLFPGDTLAPWTNRPDLILRILRSPAEDLINRLQRRVAQRARQLGLDPDRPPAFDDLPACTIASCTIEEERALLRVDRPTQGRSFQALANGVPVFPAPGLPVDQTGGDLIFPVPLQRGRNLIEAMFLDRDGRSGPRAAAYVTGRGETTYDLHLLAIGVSRYQDARLDLGLAAKDARDFAQEWQRFLGNPFHAIHTTTLLDQEVTPESVRTAARKFEQAKVNDVCILFLAGHGTHDEDGVFRFLPYGTRIDDLAGSTIPMSEFDALLGRSGSRRRFALIDTCESGLLDPDEVPPGLLAAAGSRGLRCRGLRPATPQDGPRPTSTPPATTTTPPPPATTATTPAPTMPPHTATTAIKTTPTPVALPPIRRSGDRPRRSDRQRYIYNDLTLRSGSSVLSASSGSQFSYESETAGNGLFTAAVIKMLRGGQSRSPERQTVSVSPDGSRTISWHQLCAAVASEVDTQTVGLQTPSLDRFNPHASFALRLVRRSRSSGVDGNGPGATAFSSTPAAARVLAPDFLGLADGLERDRMLDAQRFNRAVQATRQLDRPLTNRLADLLESGLDNLVGQPIATIDRPRHLPTGTPGPALADVVRLLRRTADALDGSVPWENALGEQISKPAPVTMLLINGDQIAGVYDPAQRILEPRSTRSNLSGIRVRIEPHEVEACHLSVRPPAPTTPAPPTAEAVRPQVVPAIAGADRDRLHLGAWFGNAIVPGGAAAALERAPSGALLLETVPGQAERCGASFRASSRFAAITLQVRVLAGGGGRLALAIGENSPNELLESAPIPLDQESISVRFDLRSATWRSKALGFTVKPKSTFVSSVHLLLYRGNAPSRVEVTELRGIPDIDRP